MLRQEQILFLKGTPMVEVVFSSNQKRMEQTSIIQVILVLFNFILMEEQELLENPMN
jgi:hypothetical protein